MKDKRGLLTAGAVVVALAVIAAGALMVVRRSSGDVTADPKRPGVDVTDPVVKAADAFAAEWVAGSLSVGDFSIGNEDAIDQMRVITAGLTPDEVDRPQQVVVKSVKRGTGEDADTATVTAGVTWDLGSQRTWTYDTSWLMINQAETKAGERRWRVLFDSPFVAPGLADGEVLTTARTQGPRGRIVDATGRSLVGDPGSVVVGIRKSRATDPAATARMVASLTGTNPEELVTRVAAAGDDEFIKVVTLARADYDRIRDQIRPIPGTVFQEVDGVDDLPANFARALLGTVGVATQGVIDASGGRLASGDAAGLTGLQAAQDAKLGGQPGLAVQVVSTVEGVATRTLKTWEPVAGQDLVVTIDPKVQMAADAAVATTDKPSALVAIRVSTGDVLAVANGPTNLSAYNRAMLGRYPPGSVFKIVSALGLLENGITPDTVVDCPATIVVGKEFRNAEGEVLGSVPFREDFAHSCNTAFVGEAKDLSSEALAATAARLGYHDHELGMTVFGGSVPVTDDLTEHAADMIGQGKVEASVLTVALASASVASGRSLEPRLIVDETKPPAAGDPLPAESIGHLRQMMREVVVSGTGGTLRGLPGGEVFAKTGTAEYGTESPPLTHAWITGYQGDVAFAVLVEDGGFGAVAAGPVAARFLTTLAG